MLSRNRPRLKARVTTQYNSLVTARAERRQRPMRKRADGGDSRRSGSVTPPETWHEPPTRRSEGFRIVVQPAGAGFRHVVTADEVRERLARLPGYLRAPLDVVQLSCMTRKKRTFPCYGMQWGTAIYLYPIEDSLVETYAQPPKPAQQIEARMYGGRWNQVGENRWQLTWTEETIKDFYLNNILMHELGHILDHRNSSYVDRERYAEWFAIEYGYKPTRAARRRLV